MNESANDPAQPPKKLALNTPKKPAGKRGGGWLKWIVILIVLSVLLYGTFGSMEVAIRAAQKSRLLQWKEENRYGASAALVMRETPEPFVMTLQIGLTCTGIAAAIGVGALTIGQVLPWLQARCRAAPWSARTFRRRLPSSTQAGSVRVSPGSPPRPRRWGSSSVWGTRWPSRAAPGSGRRSRTRRMPRRVPRSWTRPRRGAAMWSSRSPRRRRPAPYATSTLKLSITVLASSFSAMALASASALALSDPVTSNSMVLPTRTLATSPQPRPCRAPSMAWS